MDDDDEFGDLYTDVLRAFPSSSTSTQPPQSPPKPPSIRRPIDLNIQSKEEDILFAAPDNSNSTTSHQSANPTIVSDRVTTEQEAIVTGIDDSGRISIPVDRLEDQEVGQDQDLAGGEKNRVPESTELGEARVLESEDGKLGGEILKDSNYGDKSGVSGVEDKQEDRDVVLFNKSVDFDDEVHNSVKFDVEEAQDGIGDVGLDEPIIPGLMSSGQLVIPEVKTDAATREEASGEGDDWDSDSDDGLQIVLNDVNHGPMAMDGTGVVGGEDEDADGDDFVLVANADDPNGQAMEDQEWREDGVQAADGERKEMGEGVKVNGGMTVMPKIGYSNHGYHPFHSQFKYVRPGAAPIAGAVTTTGPGGALGQVRPLINMGPIAGRGRGDWRPPGIKGGPIGRGFGMPAWGNNSLGRGFGGGLEFTLPSHKTIFEVDIDSFEEKPWKYPGVDITDFFNFGLNEESWKDYCKQLEQLRLESTMQSKIRVYESGRTEQDYDPDMPPELAAATGISDVATENVNLGKTDVEQRDLMKGRVRPPLPTGRAIQVEGGYGERLPSIDTRPARTRDTEAIIEITLQGSLEDDSSTGNGVLERSDNNSPKVDPKGGHLVEEGRMALDTEHSDDLPHTSNGRKREMVGRRAPFTNSVNDDMPEGDGILPLPSDASIHHHPDSRGQSSLYPNTNYVNSYEERRRLGRPRYRSPQMMLRRSSRDKFLDNQKEGSVESMDAKHSPLLSSPVTLRAADELSAEVDTVDNTNVLADGSFELEGEEMPRNIMTTAPTVKDGNSLHSKKKQKLNSRVENHAIQEVDDGDDLKATRSSENSKVRSGSSRDYQKLRDSVEEEVIQDKRSTRTGNIKRQLDEDEQSFRRRSRDERPDMERNSMVVKGRKDSYPYRDWDPNLAHPVHMKAEGLDRRKERESSDGVWQRRDEDVHGRRNRTEDSRKRDFGDDMGSRHWGKIRDGDRSDKDEHLHLRKQLDNGSWRGHHDKDAGSRHRERDDNLKGRYENLDDYYSKRRKDEEQQLRRDHAGKEEILHGHREISSHRKRERDDVLDQRRRDSQPRIRENLDDRQSVRQKDEGWLQRDRAERQREKDEHHRLKQSHEESLSKRDREEGRGAVRSGRGAEDKLWGSHSRAKDEYKGSDKDYQIKDTVRHSEQVKRRDREDESLSHHRAREDIHPRVNQISNEERRSRQERSSTRTDRAPNASDNQRVHDKKPRENTKKNRESEGTLAVSKRNQEDHSGHGHRYETVTVKGTTQQENDGHAISVHRQSSRKHNRENASSDDEQHDSKRGRSKLERWTSHKERDYNINSKSSSSLRVKQTDRNNNGGTSLASKLPDDSAKSLESVDKQPLVEEKEGDLEMKDAGAKPAEDRHLDTVAKLKKRSERFKLPMPSEKEAISTKKIESDALPSVQNEAPAADAEIKQERPARKRRWVSN